MSRKKVVIFGLRDTAELANYYLEHDSEFEVAAFTADREWIDREEFCEREVVAFDSLSQRFPPKEFMLFAPMTASGMNRNRERVFLEGKSQGYDFCSYISSRATTCDNPVGENCFILEDNTIQPFVKVGDNVVLWSGNHIGHHSVIGDHVFVSSHCVISGHCHIDDYCFLGVNSTIRELTTLGKGTLLSMGATLTKQSTEEWSVYQGNPAVRRAEVPSNRVM